ncbi:MAG: methyltransferase domain-containing protein [Anaerolineae bacterium]|nr:methyltransferase domain-containing protein [Anaerolineae bacterium]
MTIPKYHLDNVFDPRQAHPGDAHSILMRLIPARSRVLELGCSSGYLSGYMEQSLGCRVTGLELDPDAVNIAALRCSEVYAVNLDDGDALEVARASAPYDVLLAPAVLEHLKHPERLLQHARDLLIPNARVIISLPNIAHWSMRLKLLTGHFDYEEYGIMDRTHVHFYTVRTGRELLEKQGYGVDDLFIAGSWLQNQLHHITALLKQPPPAPVLPGLLAYELIYTAHPQAK